MTESGVRSGRLLSIVLLLQARGTATARQIAEQLGVSVRTVYRDVGVLAGIGVPIYAETGRAGGYRLVDGYRTSLTGLTASESLALFLIGLPAPAASLGLTAPARGAEAKLLAALTPEHREQASRLRNRLHLDLPAWYHDAETPPALPALAAAVLTSSRVQLRYRRWNEPREIDRLLDPYGLVVKNGNWYLVAATSHPTRAHARTYRVSNILDLHATEETFQPPSGFDLAQFWRRHLAAFDRRRITGTARIRLCPTLVARLEDLGDAALSSAVAAGAVDPTGWTVTDLPIESPGHAASHLARYGGDVEVLHPAEVRAAMRDLGTSLLERHS